MTQLPYLTSAYPYSSERSRQRPQQSSRSTKLEFSKGADGQWTEYLIGIEFIWYILIIHEKTPSRGFGVPVSQLDSGWNFSTCHGHMEESEVILDFCKVCPDFVNILRGLLQIVTV